jgi:hypothetical protein
MIDSNAMVRCPWCLESNTLKEWDNNSYAECLNRETKRAYKHLENPSVWGKNSKSFYKCPKCSQWSRGNKLELVDTSGNAVAGLGGEPLIELNADEE